MKIVAENGKKVVKMSKKEWLEIGERSGWTKTAAVSGEQIDVESFS